MPDHGRTAARGFEVPGLLALPGLDGGDGGVAGIAGVDGPSRVLLRTTCLDTEDLRLARDGVTLRHETGGGPHWHLHLGPADADVVERGPFTAVPPRLRALLTPWLRDGLLAPVAVLRTERLLTRLRATTGGVVAELVDDSVELLQGRRVALKYRQLILRPGEDADAPEPEHDEAGADEPEPAVATADVLDAVADRLRAAGAVEGEPLPALARALGPRAAAPPDLPAPPSVAPSSPAGDVVARSLRSGVRAVLVADTDVRLGRPDGVHQLRVACRRLRSDLATFTPLLDGDWASGLREQLRWLAGELGAARDTEVLRERLAASAVSDPLAPLDPAALLALDARLAARAAAAEAQVAAALDSDRYAEVLPLLVAAAVEPRLSELAAGRAEEVLPGLVGQAWQKLAGRAGRLRPDQPDADWHAARIQAKRARYAAEAVAPALGKRARATARAAAAVQTVLGEHQDAAIAAETLLELAATHPGEGGLILVCGRLAERQRALVHRMRDKFPRVWKEARPASVARWAAG